MYKYRTEEKFTYKPGCRQTYLAVMYFRFRPLSRPELVE